MGIEKQGSKGGNYVGGFLQMFDWNAKSRKKLFSNKSDVPEQSKQKKRCDGNFPTTRLRMLEAADEIAAGSSVKGSSDHSCASSVLDDDCCGTKAPGVVARLMGLDSLPKSTMPEPYSTPFSDSHSLPDAYYQTKSLECCQQIMEPKYQKVLHRPFEKFQTETLPPKSAKSIPITHHKLLSPIKSANFVAPKDAAHIMEAAARIIDPGHQANTKSKMPVVGKTSVPLRVRNLKEKAQKPPKFFEGSQRKSESSAVRSLRGCSMNKSWNGSADATSTRGILDLEESSVGVKSKRKSISLALQAKANVQKRENGLNVNSSKNLVSEKEPCELSPNRLLKSQSTMQKSVLKKPSMQNGSSVLRQNNQKQNCIVDRGKLPSKSNSKGGKTFSGESSSARQQNSSKLAATSKVNSRKLNLEFKDNKREVLCSSPERVASKKRSVDGNYHSGKNQAAQSMQMGKTGKAIESKDSQSSWDQDSAMMGTDVVSFTFTSPMTQSQPGSGENCKTFSAGYQSKSSDGASASRFSCLGHNVKGGDALSTLLEQKLKELVEKVEFSQQNSSKSGLGDSTSSTMLEYKKAKDGVQTDNQGALEEMSVSDSNTSQAGKFPNCRLPSPVSVLDPSSFADSCNSSDTADSNSTGVSKHCSLMQAQEVLDSYSLNTYLAVQGDAELSDSDSSTFVGTVNSRRWEFEYVKEILCNIELMFKDYTSGRGRGIVSPHLFYQLESWKRHLNSGVVPIINQRLMFDCVSECLELRCRQYAGGGYRLWAKGLSVVRRKERLAEEVHKEISGWNAIGDSMIDEIVDKDMSSQFSRWLDFDIEAFELGIEIQSHFLNSLINEVVADILVL